MTETPLLPPTGPAAGPPTVAAPVQARRPRRFGVLAVVLGILLALSVMANAGLMAAVIGLAGSFMGGGVEDTLVEKVVEKGPESAKIAVIHIDGIIDEEMAELLRVEFEHAAHDSRVKAVILRINSPGGGLTASDMIYHDVRSLLSDTDKPVIASMDAIAASGGYYIACSADDIVAQQTCVTGSIGVIAEFFFLNGLLKDKLGVTTVTLKMGEQKDWPNMFAADMTEEQRQYFLDVLLRPGYDRFVDVVTEARKMKREDVLKLATGRVFMAPEAKQKGLIDEVGYFDRAIEVAKDRAGVKEARVVQYLRPFRLGEFLGLQTRTRSMLDLRPERLAGLASPKLMYLWTGN
jgi:protease-4